MKNVLVRLLVLWGAFTLSQNSAAAIPFSRFVPSDCEVFSDLELNQLLATAFVSGHDAYLRLYCIEQKLEQSPVPDTRLVFFTMYLRTTEAVVSAIEHDEFIDSAWVDTYLTRFANLYREAFMNYESAHFSAVPQAWRMAFEAAKDPNTLVSQHLLLGVSAHVNYDLAIALAGLDLQPASRYADHNAINGILGGIVDEQFALVAERYAKGLGELPEAADKVSKELFFFNLKVGREGAWKKAHILQNAPTANLREQLRRGIDAEGRVLAQAILSPKLSPQLMQALHRIEQGDCCEK